MAIPNPIYVDDNAQHDPSQVRAMAYAALDGQQGVMDPAHLAVQQFATPGAGIQCIPGGYGINCRHVGGDFESYLGKFQTAETVAVSPVGSSGPRSDLVIARMENPYVVGTGSWPIPADPVLGPYQYIRVIENVPANTNDVTAYNNTWEAITLARITRPANTGVIQQTHITDLRSAINKGGGERIIIIDSPPVTPPPIAAEWYTDFNQSAAAPPGTDTVHDYWTADTTWQSWPDAASWNLPIPSWATVMDLEVDIFNAQLLTNDVYAQMAILLNGARQATSVLALDYVAVPDRRNIAYGQTINISSSLRGKVIPVVFQVASYFSAPGRLDAKGGTTAKLQVNFKRFV